MTYQTFFWDFDGTLFDTYPTMVEAFMKALMMQHVDEIEMDEVAFYETMRRHSLGAAVKQFSAEFGISDSRLETDYRQIEATMIMSAKPFEGIVPLLSVLHQNGGQHFLLTHRDQTAERLLIAANIKGLFTDFVTNEQPFARKPAPDSLNYLIQKHDVLPKTAIMIGDRNLDVQVGHNAGIAGALFDPGRLINSALSRPEIDVTNASDLAAMLLA